MAEAYRNIINNLRKGLIDQCELNSLENGFEQSFNRIEDLEVESYKNDEVKAEMQSQIDCLKSELVEVQQNKPELPTEPIKIANCLIDRYIEHVEEYDRFFTIENAGKIVAGSPNEEFRQMQIGELKQIAEHLLVYCNHAGVE